MQQKSTTRALREAKEGMDQLGIPSGKLDSITRAAEATIGTKKRAFYSHTQHTATQKARSRATSKGDTVTRQNKQGVNVRVSCRQVSAVHTARDGKSRRH